MRVREVIRGTLSSAGLDVRRKPAALIRSPYELMPHLALVAAHWVTTHPAVTATVVQVGAYDGEASDPLADAITRYGWRAILVEPQPRPAASAAERYAASPNVTVVQAAVSDHDGTQALYTVRPADGQPEWAAQIASFDRHHIDTQAQAAGTQFDVDEIQVETITPATLLDRASVDRIDVLQIDTEGYDLEVLHLFDIPARLPAIINYEHQHLSRRDRAEAVSLLIGCGYRVAMASFDTLAYRGAP